MEDIRILVERLSALLNEGMHIFFTGVVPSLIINTVPGNRYALTLQLMLKRFKKRKTNSMSQSPQIPRPGHRGSMDHASHSGDIQMGQAMAHPHQPMSPTYDPNFVSHPDAIAHGMSTAMTQQQFAQNANIDQIWRGFETTSTDQLPVWLSDQSLGGQTFSQYGIDAFLLPNDYLPPGPQIW